MPARTREEAERQLDPRPSMEGRARARPDTKLSSRRCGQYSPSMEGRARARPDGVASAVDSAGKCPSMEGRARARPDESARRPRTSITCAFNGGAGTCPPGLQA